LVTANQKHGINIWQFKFFDIFVLNNCVNGQLFWSILEQNIRDENKAHQKKHTTTDDQRKKCTMEKTQGSSVGARGTTATPRTRSANTRAWERWNRNRGGVQRPQAPT